VLTFTAEDAFAEAFFGLPLDRRVAVAAAIGELMADLEERVVRLPPADDEEGVYQLETVTGERLTLRFEQTAGETLVVWLDIRRPRN
jgi:hypothetical protein